MQVKALDSEICKHMTTGLMTEATKGDDPVKAAKVIEESLKKAGIPAVAKVEGDVVTIKKVLKD